LTDDTKHIAGWNFDEGSIWSNNKFGSGAGIELNQSSEYISIHKSGSNDYVKMFYTGVNDWGIKGYVGGSPYFELGDDNQIAGWTFDTEKLTNVASTTMKIAFNNSTTAYIGASEQGFEVWRKTTTNEPKVHIGTKDGSSNLQQGFEWDGDEYTLREYDDDYYDFYRNLITSKSSSYWSSTESSPNYGQFNTDNLWDSIYESSFGSGDVDNWTKHSGTGNVTSTDIDPPNGAWMLEVNTTQISTSAVQIIADSGSLSTAFSGRAGMSGQPRPISIAFDARAAVSNWDGDILGQDVLSCVLEVRESSETGTLLETAIIPVIKNPTTLVINSYIINVHTSASSIYLVIQLDLDDGNYQSPNPTLWAYFDNFVVKQWVPFNEITDDGILFWNSAHQFAQIGKDKFIMKGVELEAKDTIIYGDLTVTGNANIGGTGGSGANYLPQLVDVTITSVGDNEILQYDSATSSWINQTLAEAGIASTLNALSDVTITSVGNDEVLQYTGSVWENQTLAEAGIQPADAGLTSLAGLTYVSDSFIKITATDTYAVRTIAETKTDLSLNNVENTALSTWAGTSNIITVGDIIAGRTALTSGLAYTDELLVSDAGVIKKMDVSVLSDFQAGAGLASTNGVLSVGMGIGLVAYADYIDLDINDLTAVSPLASGDYFAIEDATDSSTKKVQVSTVETYLNSNLTFVTSVAGGNGIDSTGGTTPTISLNVSELTVSTADGDGDYFVVDRTDGEQFLLTKANINLSGFNNDLSVFVSDTGNNWNTDYSLKSSLAGADLIILEDSAASYAVKHTTLTDLINLVGINIDGYGLQAGSGGVLAVRLNEFLEESTIEIGDFLVFWDITATATNRKITHSNFLDTVSGEGLSRNGKAIDISLNSFGEKTGDLVATDRLIGVSGTTHFAETISAIPLSIFDNDSGWITGNETITLSGDVTGSGATSIATTIAADAVHATMLNDDVISGQTDIGAAIVGTDELLISDGGVLRRTDMSRLVTYIGYDQEQVEDWVAGLMIAGNVTTWTYVDASGTLKVDVGYSATNMKLTGSTLDTIQDIATSSSPTFVTSKLTALTDNYIPYHVSDASGLANSILQQSATKIGINITPTTYILEVNGDIFASGDLRVDDTGNLIMDGNTIISTALELANISKATIDNVVINGNQITTSTGNLQVDAAGDIVFNPTGNDLLPATSYDLNIGSSTAKYKTLHASELWVDTLVSQDVIATTGGRIIVTPSTHLEIDINTVVTTITVKHNNLVNGDIVIMEKSGQVEFMSIDSSASANGSNWDYTVTRNLDGTGANSWIKGDAVMSTGQTGDGFIDIYSHYGLRQNIFTTIFNYDESNNGSDLVTNGDFLNWTGDDPDDWIMVGTEVVNDILINEDTDRAAFYKDVSGSLYIYQDILKVGKQYRVTFDIDYNNAIDGFYIQLGSSDTKVRFTGTGAKSHEGTCVGDGKLIIGMDNNSTGNVDIIIDDVVCVQLGNFSTNYANDPDFTLFHATADAQGDCVYFGKPGQFRQITFDLGTAGTSEPVYAWEFWNGTAWTGFTPTTAPDFESTGVSVCEFSAVTLTGWTECYVGNSGSEEYLYWIRVREASGDFTVLPVTQSLIYTDDYQTGATIVGNIRNSSTFNDWSEAWAIGNLDGLYGYGVDTYGAAFGKYINGSSFVTIDATNGIMIQNRTTDTNIQRFKVDLSGNVTIGNPSYENVYITDSTMQFKDGSTVLGQLTGAEWFIGQTTSEHIKITPTEIEFNDSSTTLGSLSAGLWTIGGTTESHLLLSSSTLTFKYDTTVLGSLTSTVWTLGEIANSRSRIVLDSTNGIKLISKNSGGVDNEGIHLAIDGSGSLASGDISWDTSGNMTVTGDIQTATGTGQRVVLDASTNQLNFYDTGNNNIVVIGEDVYSSKDGIEVTDGTVYVNNLTGANDVYYSFVASTTVTTPTASIYSLTSTADAESSAFGVFGVYGRAFSSGTHTGLTVGVYGHAQATGGSGTLWAAYFDGGNVLIKNYLRVGGLADSTTNAFGIKFGVSEDTNLYRSGASALKTDDEFEIVEERILLH
ncbi:MAG: hypothetical protein ACW99A_13410, partial [Candidatus Kariarchaeaceae archaeon]